MKTSDFKVGQYYVTEKTLMGRMVSQDLIIKIEKIEDGKVYWRDILRRNKGSVKTTTTTMMTKLAEPITDNTIKKRVFYNIFKKSDYYIW